MKLCPACASCSMLHASYLSLAQLLLFWCCFARLVKAVDNDTSSAFAFPFKIKTVQQKNYQYVQRNRPKSSTTTTTLAPTVAPPSPPTAAALTADQNKLSTIPNNATRIPIYKMQKKYIEHMLVKYERSVRPFPANGGPTEARVCFVIRSISSINEYSMDFTIDMFLRQVWNDPRLSFDNSGYETDIPYVKPTLDFAKNVWSPDGFFPHQRRGHGHVITVPNRNVRIYPNGDVHMTDRYTLVIACDMFLSRYPFDVQNCFVELSSFSHTTEELVFLWSEDAVIANMETEMPKFRLAKIEELPCHFGDKTGNYSCLRFKLTFTREIGFHVIETYTPTTFLVIASWMGFWIDANSVPARVSLSVTAMLTTVAQCSNIKHGLPVVSYIKAIDIWLYVCILFVFSSLVEFAIVNYLATMEAKRLQSIAADIRKATQQPCPSCKAAGFTDANGPAGPSTKRDKKPDGLLMALKILLKILTCACCPKCSKSCHSRQVDRASRVVFPVTFGIFAFVYVNVYAF